MVAVLDERSLLDGREVDAIRDCLHELHDHERPLLWQLLDPMLRALDALDLVTIGRLPGLAPEGPIRRCLLRVGMPVMAAARAGMTKPAPGGFITRPPERRYVYGRAQPEFLGMYSGLAGTVAPVETWSNGRTGLYWEKVEADAFAAVNTSRRTHEPVPLDYRHDPAVVLGCSRGWTLADDGALCGRFSIGSYPAGQHAARAADRGDLGLSMSVRFATRWLAHPSPAEWSPADGRLDVCVRDDASVESVALTPTPTYPAAEVSRVW